MMKLAVGKKWGVVALAWLVSWATPRAAAGELLPAGAAVIDENPAAVSARGFWTKAPWATAADEGESHEACVKIEVPKEAPAANGVSVESDVEGNAIKLKAGRYEITRSLDLARLRGWRVKIAARVKTAGVPQPAVPWEGLRVGVMFETGIVPYNANANGYGDIPRWREIVLDGVRIPEDAQNARLFVGLISTKGTLWLDRVRVTLVEPPLTALAKMRTAPVAQTEWRGSDAGNSASIDRLAKDWKLNLVRWWLKMPPYSLPGAEFAAKREAALRKLDAALAQAEASGVKIEPVVSLRNDWMVKEKGNTHLVFLDPAARKRFLETWEIIAQRYKGRPGIYGYDVLNEPVLRVPPAPGCTGWEGLAGEAAALINRIDPKAAVAVEPEEWWNTQSFLKLRPVEGKNIVYSVHMYRPFQLTHQGIKERKGLGVRYPGTIGGVKWDKEALRQALKPARDFQLAYGVRMGVGEFGCIRWAPGDSAARWVKDCIDLFEEYGWDWTFHAIYDWDGWNPDFGEDPSNTKSLPEPSAEKKVLLEAYSKNVPVKSETP